ncbi:hypothetical protein ACWGOK_36160 [Streptomyces eurythermus]
MTENRVPKPVTVALHTTSAPDAGEVAAFEVMRDDSVAAGRAASSGQFLAGLIAAAQLATVSRPDKLARDIWPDEDPVLVQAVWDRALAVGFHAGRTSSAPRLFRDQMERVEGVFAEVGWHAMAGSVARSRRLVAGDVPAHPVDGEATQGH